VATRSVHIPTLVIAIVALVFSVLSMVVTFNRNTAVTSGSGEPSSAATQMTIAAEPTEAAPTASTNANPSPTDTGGVNPQPNYTLSYEDKELHIPQSVEVDLDEPRVNVKTGGDVRYDYRGFTTTNAAAVTRSPNATPEDCEEAIQTSPLTKPIAASESLVICIQTSAEDASEQGVSQKLTRISIKSINKEDVVTVLVTAWNVPT
jgi:hypothetical protein